MKTKRNRRSTAQEATEQNATEKLIHANFASGDLTFRVCCLKAKTPASKRQVAKFKGSRGTAYAELATLTQKDFDDYMG